MAPLRHTTKFDLFLSLDCAPTPFNPAQSKERKGLNFAIWQPCLEVVVVERLQSLESKLVKDPLRLRRRQRREVARAPGLDR